MTKHQACAKCIRQFVGPDSNIGDNLCPDCDYEVHCKCDEKIVELEKQLTDEKDNHQGARECLDMVKDCLEELGTDMSAVPPMFYREAIRNMVIRKLKEQHSTRQAAEKAKEGEADFKPKQENWFYCEHCQTVAYQHDCCGNISCSGGGCKVCCQGPNGTDGPNGVIQRMIRDGTAPDESTIPHREDGMAKLLSEAAEKAKP